MLPNHPFDMSVIRGAKEPDASYETLIPTGRTVIARNFKNRRIQRTKDSIRCRIFEYALL